LDLTALSLRISESRWSDQEKRLLDGLDTPGNVQGYLDSLPYDPSGGFRSPRLVMREGKAQCYSGALFAAAALRYHGFPPLLVELAAVNDDEHVLAVFKANGAWGAVAKSNFTTLRFREPVYRTLRELAMSYFDVYFNTLGEKTLRAYSRPLDLRRFDGAHWMTSEEVSSPIEDAISRIRHYPLLTQQMADSLEKVDKHLFTAGLLGADEAGLFKAHTEPE